MSQIRTDAKPVEPDPNAAETDEASEKAPEELESDGDGTGKDRENESNPERYVLKLGGQYYHLPSVAILCMLVAILAPSVTYSISRRGQTPADLLIAVCVAVFSSVMALWILDVTSVSPFRSSWLSKSIWVAAIVSILGTSVGVYKDFFTEYARPYEGPWEIFINGQSSGELSKGKMLIMTYSRSSNSYWGYSDARNIEDSPVLTKPEEEQKPRRVYWVEIERFDPEAKEISIIMYMAGFSDKILFKDITIKSDNKTISGDAGQQGTVSEYHLRLTRPR